MSTLIVIAALLCAAPAAPATAGGTAAPAPTSKAAKLTAYIVRVNPKARPTAAKLARAILREAKRFRLDPALFAAVAHNESWYNIKARGKSYERGCWQLWPWAYFLRPAWDRMRAVNYGLPGWPDKDWNQLTRKQQIRASRDPKLSTFLAAFLVRWHVDRRCRRKQTAYCYGHYNSGNRKPRRAYVAKLRRRARAIRRALRN